MIKMEDLNYICTNLGNLSGLPVRLFDDEKEIFYYSTINFTKDPFSLDKDKAFTLKEHVTYFINEFGFFYGIINYKNIKIILGPSSEFKSSEQTIKDFAFKLNIHPSDLEDFIVAINSLINYPLMSVLQMLCMVNFALSGEKENLANVTIHEKAQNLIIDDIESAKISNEHQEDDSIQGPYNALDIENCIIDIVMRGDVSALNAYIKDIPAIRSGTVAKNQLRQAKNIFIVTTTLVSRAAIRGGLDVTNALRLSDIYIQKCEMINDIQEITELSFRMVMDYTQKVESIHFGESPSKLVLDVTRYIQNHLSETIKVEDISKSIYLSRSRLSTAFKKETGINLYDYIYKVKLNEAKRLLRYSNRSISSIAFYLGFSSQSHFTKIFKSLTSLTPFEYRQKHQRK